MAKKIKTKATKDEKDGENILTITQELIDLNPEELKDANVGDEIELTDEVKTTLKFPEVKEEVKKNILRGAISILKGEEYIRTYDADQTELAMGFLGKDSQYIAISPDKIESIMVSWRESEKTMDSDTNRLIDTGRMKTENHLFTEKVNGKDWKEQARTLANAGQKRSCTAKLVS